MITTVLRNLIGNAIKFTHSGGNITIEGDCDPNDQTLTVIVSDNGVGIDDQKVLDSLFDLVKKNRRSSKGTANESGSGLGLVICKDFIERHGGKIWAESEGAGKGTTIKFTLPHKKQEAK
jgi:signal transduction histidine kinase